MKKIVRMAKRSKNNNPKGYENVRIHSGNIDLNKVDYGVKTRKVI
jgi:hypothetical protein